MVWTGNATGWTHNKGNVTSDIRTLQGGYNGLG